MANYKETKEPELYSAKAAYDDGHKRAKMAAGAPEEYDRRRLAYVNKVIPSITTNWCSFGQKLETINSFRNMCSAHFGTLTPLKIRVDCHLYHGCDYLFEDAYRESIEVYFNNSVSFNEQIDFKLKYCQLPEKTRLSFNIVLIFQEKNQPELIIGTVSTNLFSKSGKFKSGTKELNIWPFYKIDERLGCMKEYCGLSYTQSQVVRQNHAVLPLYFCRLLLQFETFVNPMYYSSRDDKKIELYKLTKTTEDEEDS
jgi:hypothetical protein